MLIASIIIKSVPPEVKNNKCVKEGGIGQIYTTFSYFGKECHSKYIITTEPLDNYLVDDCIIKYCNNEVDALLGWTKLIKENNVCIIVGYRINKFELPFMIRRAKLLGCYENFIQLGNGNIEVIDNTIYPCCKRFISGIDIIDL